MHTLAVIIVSWNVRALLDRCLTALRADLQTTALDAQVWVVDNASTDDSAALVRERHPWVALEALDENLGFVRGNNRILAALEAEGQPDLVWLLNPDTEVRPGATAALVRHFDAHPRAGIAGPCLRNPDGSLQPGAFRFPGLVQPLADLGRLPARLYETRLNGRYPAARYEAGAPFRIGHPLGAAMMARGATVAEVGLLDEGFFMYCEEIDWAWRMRKAGWEAWLVPAAEVVHHGGASTRQDRPATTAHLWVSRARLYRKHHSAWLRRIVRHYVRRTFSARLAAAETSAWRDAYRAILEAWADG